jgi:glycosyltransferase involved in cell wall biosynthesis
MSRSRLCFVVSVPLAAKAFLSAHLTALNGLYNIDLVTNYTNSSELESMAAYINPVSIDIRRRVSPLADLAALVRLFQLFRREGYAAVTSVTPKAGLLSMMAAWLARVPVRIHVFTGQVWATRSGWQRRLLKASDWLMARLATHVLADSPSQSEFLAAEGIVSAARIGVLGKGSICGVDGGRFYPDASRRSQVRHAHGLPESAVVFLFLGRLNRDKGVLDLAEAFAQLGDPDAWLLVVGPDEAGMQAEMQRRMGAAVERCRFVGYTEQPEDFMAAADVFCLPSYREGFGMVVIEAAAAGLPAIASRIYGVTDAVEEGITGVLHTPGAADEIAQAMALLLNDAALRARMGDAARVRALRDFSQQAITRAWVDFYRALV